MFAKIKSDSITSVLFQVLGYLSSFLIGTYLVKTMAVEDFGAYGILNVIFMVAPVLVTLNVQEYFFVNVSEARSRDHNLTLFSTVGLFAIASSILFALLFAIPALRSSVLHLLKLEAHETSFLCVLAIIAIHSVTLSYLRFFMFTKKVMAYNVLTYLLLALWFVPITAVDVTVAQIFYAKLAAAAIVALIAGAAFYRYTGHIGFGYAFRKPILASAMAFGLGSYFGTVCNLLMDVSDKLLLSAMVSNRSVGMYNFATMPFAIMASFVAGTVFLVAVPYVNEMHHRKEPGKYDLYRALVKNLVIYLSPVFVFFCSFSDNIILILGKPEYLEVAGAYTVLSMSYMAFVLVAIPRQELYLMRRLKAITLIAASGLLLNLGLDLILIPMMDYDGAIFASLFARLVMLALLFGNAKDLTLGRWRINPLARWLTVMAVMVVIGRLVAPAIDTSARLPVQLGYMAAGFAFFYIFYIGLLFLVRLNGAREVEWLKKVLNRS